MPKKPPKVQLIARNRFDIETGRRVKETTALREDKARLEKEVDDLRRQPPEKVTR